MLVEHRGASSLFRVNERCLAGFPSAAELVLGEVQAGLIERCSALVD